MTRKETAKYFLGIGCGWFAPCPISKNHDEKIMSL